MTDTWGEEFRCWNTAEPVIVREPHPLSRYCEICGVNKPLELHELWCPNEPDRLAKDDPEFWYDNAEGDECGCAVHAGEGLPDEHESHINRILDAINIELATKYRKGQQEHGGKLWLKPDMLDHAIEEVLDLIVYLYTLREQQRGK